MPPSPCPHPLPVPVGTWVPRALPRQAHSAGVPVQYACPSFAQAGPRGLGSARPALSSSSSIIVDSEAHPPGARHSAPPRHPPAAGPGRDRPIPQLEPASESSFKSSIFRKCPLDLPSTVPSPRSPNMRGSSRGRLQGMRPSSPVWGEIQHWHWQQARLGLAYPSGPLAQAAQNGSLEERRRRLLLGPRWFSASVCNIRQNTPRVVSSDTVGI